MRVKSKGKTIKIPKDALTGRKTKFDAVKSYLRKTFKTTSFRILKGK